MAHRVLEGLSLRWLLTAMRTWWWLLLAVNATMAAAAAAVLALATPSYEATATLVISPEAQEVVGWASGEPGLSAGARIRAYREHIRTQQRVMESQEMGRAVLDQHDLWDDPRLFPETGLERSSRPAALVERIRTRWVPDSRVVEIRCRHFDPDVAALLANATATAYRDQDLRRRARAAARARAVLESAGCPKEAFEPVLANEQMSENVRILDEASVPASAVWPRPWPLLGGSAALAVLLWLLCVLLLERRAARRADLDGLGNGGG